MMSTVFQFLKIYKTEKYLETDKMKTEHRKLMGPSKSSIKRDVYICKHLH